MHSRIAVVLTCTALAGCAVGPELRALRAGGQAGELTHVPFFPQQAFHCGPAALATVLVADGVDVTPEALAPQVYVPERQGSLQAELIAAARRHGRVPYVLEPHADDLLQEVHSGRPVLVLQNLGLERWPTWHYAVVVGFDAEADRVLLRSGTEARLEMRARRFLSTWDRGHRWAMVVAPPHQPPASARPQGWLRGAAAFESLGELEAAAAAYLAATERWPQHAPAWTALGNAYFLQGRHARAATAYTQALALDGDDWVARNNLVHALLAQGCAGQARVLVAQAGAPPPRMGSAWAATLARVAGADASADHCRYP